MTELAAAGAPDTFPAVPTTFLFPGPAGAIEVATDVPPTGVAHRGVAIVCHPHPLHGGTMTNKVVTTVERALRELGFATLRFNFRGIGRTEGAHDHGDGEADDLVALGEWLARAKPGEPLWLAGFSFGSYVALQGAARLPVQQLVSIAPPVDKYRYRELPRPACPWLVVIGTADDVVMPESVIAWAQSVTPPPVLERMDDAGHFFHGRLVELREVLKRNLA